MGQTVLPRPHDLATSVCDEIIAGAFMAEGSTDELLAFLEETQDDADGDDETDSASAFATIIHKRRAAQAASFFGN